MSVGRIRWAELGDQQVDPLAGIFRTQPPTADKRGQSVQCCPEHLGQSVWVDFLSRQALEDGTIERMIRHDAVVGMTSNPTIFQKAMADGSAYDDQLRDVLRRETDGKQVFLALAVQDVREACDLLRPIWERSECAVTERRSWPSISIEPSVGS